MKALLFLLSAALLLAARPAATTYQLLPADSRLAWTGHAELGSYAPSGTLQLGAGTLRYNGRLLAGRVRIDMRSLHHDNAQLRDHLRGPEFFDVERFPTAEFQLQQAASGQVTGRLTVKGVAQTVTFPLSLTTEPDGALRLRGTASLDRTRFGIRYLSRSFFADLGDRAIRNDFQLTFELLARPMP